MEATHAVWDFVVVLSQQRGLFQGSSGPFLYASVVFCAILLKNTKKREKK